MRGSKTEGWLATANNESIDRHLPLSRQWFENPGRGWPTRSLSSSLVINRAVSPVLLRRLACWNGGWKNKKQSSHHFTRTNREFCGSCSSNSGSGWNSGFKKAVEIPLNSLSSLSPESFSLPNLKQETCHDLGLLPTREACIHIVNGILPGKSRPQRKISEISKYPAEDGTVQAKLRESTENAT